MPVNPTAWTADQAVSANKLNTDLYNYEPGQNFTPNGILFHTQRPILIEFAHAAVTAASIPYSNTNTYASWKAQYNTSSTGNYQWMNWFDSAANYGPGADEGNLNASAVFQAEVPGQDGAASDGVKSFGNGYYMVLGHFGVSGVPTAAASFGVGVYGGALSGNTPSPMLSSQLVGSANNALTYGLDLVQPPNPQVAGNGTVIGTNLSVTTGTGSANGTPAVASAAFDPTGMGSFLTTWWASISQNNVKVAGGPNPPTAFTGASLITSANLNATVNATLEFLNSPPVLRASSVNGTTITASTPTAVPLTNTSTGGLQVDTFAGLSSSTYTVPVSGVYLVHGAVAFAGDATASYNMLAGIHVNSTTYWGPAYQSSGGGSNQGPTIPLVTRLLDLNAGDTVQLYCYQNKSSSTTLNNGSQAPCRLILQWMGALGTPSTLWANPDPGYRWQAGDPNLVSDFNTHLVNDLGFLVNRPYLLTYQATAQTGVADNSNQLVVTDSATGQVHASVGDNYSGWTSGSSNQYTCQRAGWYLVVGSFVIAHIGTGATTTSLLASAFAAGLGYNQANNYDGQQLHTTSGALSPGADVVRVIYMGVGDTISFNMNVSGSTFNTSVNNLADQTSHFGLVWLGQ